MKFSSIATFSSLSAVGTRSCYIMTASFAIALLIGSGTIDFTNSRLVAEDDRLALFVFP